MGNFTISTKTIYKLIVILLLTLAVVICILSVLAIKGYVWIDWWCMHC